MKTDTQIRNEGEFNRRLDDLFDIAHAIAMISICEDRECLMAQKEGRRGAMLSVDNVVQKKRRRSRCVWPRKWNVDRRQRKLLNV